MEVGGRATQDAKAEGIGTTPWMGKVELCLEQQSRVESGTETENIAWSKYRAVAERPLILTIFIDSENIKDYTLRLIKKSHAEREFSYQAIIIVIRTTNK